MNQPEPLKTFIIYARSDEAYKQQLLLHLRPLRNSGLLTVWHDGNILPGEDWERAIKKELKSSDLVLLLVSANSLNSDFIQGQELRTALDRLREGLARVVPVIVSPCGWRFDPVLSQLQALPLFGSEGPKAVSDRVWQNADEAWANVVDNLGNMALELNEQRRSAIAAEKDAEYRKAEQAREKERLAALSASQKAKEVEAQTSRALEAKLAKEAEAQKEKALEAQRAQQAAAKKAKEKEASRLHTEQTHNRIKTPNTGNRKPISKMGWAAIGAGVGLFIFLVGWMMDFSIPGLGSSKTVVLNSPAFDTLHSADPDPIKSQTDEGATSISPEKLPANTGVKIDKPINPPVEGKKPDFTFDYKMVRVPGGSFTMGSPVSQKDRSDNECEHEVKVRSFGIGQTEVTQAQWKSVMGTNPSKFKGDNLPVEQVSWNDVQAFIKKLNEKTGQQYRLPTEEEWEFAARGGNSSKKTLYSGSNDLRTVAWYRSNSSGNTHPVGTKKANELGLYDMSGNVWEWCQDLYGPYRGCSTPSGKSATVRVLRGGSWDDIIIFCQVSVRINNYPNSRNYSVGFRLAQD